MAQTKIKKYQLELGTNDNVLGITNVDIAGNAAIVTSKLAEGADFIKRTGTVAFTADQSMGGFKLTNVGAPVSANDAVRLIDLQNNQAGLSGKTAARVATTGAETYTISSGVVTTIAGTTIDGVTVAVNDRVLIKNAPAATGAGAGAGTADTTQPGNGIYYVSAIGASISLVRAADADSSAELVGAYIFVTEGATNGDSGWLISTDGTITVNTTPILFVQFTGTGQITAGTGMTKTGNVLNVNTANSARIVVNADNIDLATTITAGGPTGSASAVPVITYDAYGRLTAVTTATITAAAIGAQPVDADLSAIAAQSGTGILVRTGTDTWATRTWAAPAAGITITNPGGVAGNMTLALANDLAALEGLAANGFAVRTGADTWAQRSVVGTAGRITVSNGDGVSGNPTLDLATVAVTGSGPAVSTVDGYGRVTALRALATGDLPSGTLTTANVVTRETPGGTVNGSNTAFTLAFTPVAGTEHVYLNGVLQEPGAGNDYTITGTAISFIVAPFTGDKIRVSYLK